MLPPCADNQPLQEGPGLTALAVRSSANTLCRNRQAPSVDRLDKLKVRGYRITDFRISLGVMPARRAES
jgi:hypothetical protein